MSRFFKTAIPLLVILSLFGIMLCHQISGPFTVVNGPFTAFLSLKHATVVQLAIVAALIMVVAVVASLATARRPISSPEPPLRSSTVPDEFCTLLC